MNNKILSKLEFDKIINRLTRCCASNIGKELAEQLKPTAKLETVKIWLEQTSEAKEIWRTSPMIPLAGIKDIGPYLQQVKKGGILTASMLFEVGETMSTAQQLRQFVEKLNLKFQQVRNLGLGLVGVPRLIQEINRSILPEGEVADAASVELRQIRSGMRSKQGQVKDKLDSIIRSTTLQKYLQEPIVTIRNQRYVVPVKIEYKQQVPGILHDQSASGATLFIEPMAVVELNNDLRRLEVREEQEVQRILAALSALIEVHLVELEQNLDILAELDFIFAKGKLSQLMDGGAPELNDRQYIKIIQGRHPLITGKVVPVSIELGGEFTTLVITGPNTGGKTVTLKTVGLFVLMAQAGLHLPCDEGSSMGLFEQVFVDIGDEQSIEQSLSTFSSHMTNIVDITENLTAKSIVLLDELGAGTDPTEGAALAMAILDYLRRHGARTIATTHYSELKAYAYAHQEVENASVEFDSVTLSPTYKLLIGVPGRSNAFEISSRLGLRAEVIGKAKEFLTQEEVKVANLIKNLEQNQLIIQQERKEAELLRQEALHQLELAGKKEELIKNREQQILQEANEEAIRILAETKRTANELIKEIREAKNTAAVQQERLAMQAREKLTKEQDKRVTIRGDLAREMPVESLKNVKPGDKVYLPKFNQKGEVLSAPSTGGEVQVQAGIIKLTVKVSDLRLLKEEKEDKGQVIHGSLAKRKAEHISPEIDIRGYLVDEALHELEKYLDDALLTGLPWVRIIHGKGTGALRQAIQEFLRQLPYVRKYRLGGHEEGGTGVTVIEF
ncbi:MAG: endonuclease MutS2 [Clostridia bacterium]|nr:endonuclease MutS2 [Clostridia bacterium]